MSNTNALAPSRTHGSDRFYCPPPVRRNQKLQQIQRPFNSDTRVDSVEPDLRTDSHDSALLRPNSVASSSPPITNSYTNFDRILESLTPFVPAQISSEPGVKGHRAPQSNSDPWFFLEDLWESFTESSAYGVEVPLIINGSESIQQYYIPYLSAIQLYAEESYEAEVSSSSGQLVYEYFEGALPHLRPPFHNKISILASEFPNLKKYGSNDLLPSSWFSVSWYPIYRIPVGSTLKSLDASFLTFHSLSTNSRSRDQPQRSCSGRMVQPVDISLPIFGFASYKYRGSVLSPDGASELVQANSLLLAAADWLQSLQVKHPDYEHFVSRSSQRR
ncbi:hypothetical protein TanjilG_16946 [Lupinus angustifolius]|uniref:uncharacterized protein LOC109335199 isoform X1 n=1 Tax=Lupinus angustifolius TaxID=3871 RepID=UPI00090DDFA9|nr:PREDICTED: uncharacterized protein LOC109335199 isoform X1 [Lupinus angustifolius]OIV90986.1 hypothetical protein TanjilG_16946 [Lupinus angustifolius]